MGEDVKVETQWSQSSGPIYRLAISVPFLGFSDYLEACALIHAPAPVAGDAGPVWGRYDALVHSVRGTPRKRVGMVRIAVSSVRITTTCMVQENGSLIVCLLPAS